MTKYPVNGVLDLHVFHPREAVDVTREYLHACREAGISRVRIIHGKGRSVLRGRILRLLESESEVLSWHNAPDASGWGAVIAYLRLPENS